MSTYFIVYCVRCWPLLPLSVFDIVILSSFVVQCARAISFVFIEIILVHVVKSSVFKLLYVLMNLFENFLILPFLRILKCPKYLNCTLIVEALLRIVLKFKFHTYVHSVYDLSMIMKLLKIFHAQKFQNYLGIVFSTALSNFHEKM